MQILCLWYFALSLIQDSRLSLLHGGLQGELSGLKVFFSLGLSVLKSQASIAPCNVEHFTPFFFFFF
jgi:hypothetical protein